MTVRMREVEAKYDVDDQASVPEFADLPDVAQVRGPTTVRLEAEYFDTTDLALGRRSISLRRRIGGVDEGWHLKLPIPGARYEIRAPLGRNTRTPPVALRRIVQDAVRNATIEQVATVSTQRTTWELRNADNLLLAELCDDKVVAVRRLPHGREECMWREWEFETHAADRRLVQAADSRIRQAGAVSAAHGSKVSRVLGLEAEHDPQPPLDRAKRSSEHDVLRQHLKTITTELRLLDPLARADIPDAVHQLRVRFRRLRSTLTTFDKCFDQAITDPVRADCAWISELLGRPRDLEVVSERLEHLVGAESPSLVRGHITTFVASQLGAAHRTAHRDAVEAMASDRYFALLGTVNSWSAAPPWNTESDRPVTKRLTKSLDRSRAELDSAALAAAKAVDPARTQLLHDVRKAAKRTRYAAEMLTSVIGPEALNTARDAERIQSVLGHYIDAVVAGEHVLGLADAALADGPISFTLGVLYVRLQDEAVEHVRTFERVLAKTRHTK